MTFSVNDIRPDDLVAKKRAYQDADIDYLRQRSKKFASVECPACGKDQPQFLFNKSCHAYVECQSCFTVYVNPRPPAEMLAEFYRQSKNYWFWNRYIFPASAEIRREKIFKPRVQQILDLCSRFNLKRDSILEVGAGYGLFCEEISKKAYFKKVIALEPVPDLAESCRKKGITVIEKPVEELKPNEVSPDVVVSFEVIEHLFSPYQFLNSISSILPKGGLIILTCPNAHGFDTRILGKYAPAYDHEHLNYFNTSSLALLLSRTGFEVRNVFTPGELDVDIVRRAAIETPEAIQNNDFIKSIVLQEDESLRAGLQAFLKQYGLSSHMWIVGQKR